LVHDETVGLLGARRHARDDADARHPRDPRGTGDAGDAGGNSLPAGLHPARGSISAVAIRRRSRSINYVNVPGPGA
jgi:hypothetical protein